MWIVSASNGELHGPFDTDVEADRYAMRTLIDVTAWDILPLIEPDTSYHTGFRPHDPQCPLTMSHTRFFCGYAGCGDS